jgi:hypothetical protein
MMSLYNHPEKIGQMNYLDSSEINVYIIDLN